MENYLIAMAVSAGLYALMALGLNVIWGMAGQVNLGLVVAFALIDRLAHSPFGRVLRAIRDDEQAAAVAGKHTLAFKVKAFAFGSAVLGLSGALYGHYTSYIAPDLFLPLLTLYIKLALLAGG